MFEFRKREGRMPGQQGQRSYLPVPPAIQTPSSLNELGCGRGYLLKVIHEHIYPVSWRNTDRPFSVRRYCCKRLFGLSGMVRSIMVDERRRLTSLCR